MYPRLLQSVLLPAYDRARGRSYSERRRFLDDSQWWSPERVRAFQWAELRKLLAHVFASVPYLREKYRAAGIVLEDLRSFDDFRRLPPLTRAEVNAHGSDLCSTTYRGRLLAHATGGSTGTPTRFFRTYESYDWRTAAKDRAYAWTGWHLGERAIYLWGAPVGSVSWRQVLKTRAYEAVHRQLVINTFAQSDALWDDVVARARVFRPVLIVGYVSSLEAFAAYLQRTKRTMPGVTRAIAAAEPLHADARRRIEQGLGVPLYNTYGSREFMSIAAECECRDGLHVHAENLVVETVDRNDHVPSEILITDLHNYGMPFVRYASGDLGRLMNRPCRCGRGLPRLDAIEGRVLDALRTADGRIVPGEFFPHLLKDIPELAEYRVEQTRLDRLVISAVLTRPLSERSDALLRGEIRKVFGPGTACELRAVAEIPKLRSGKRRVTVGLRARPSAPEESAMVIAHVIDSLEVGGAETVVAALCRSHAAAGHRVEVHCLTTGGPLASELEAEGVPVYVHASARAARAAWNLFRAFRRSRPDVVHCHNKTATIYAAAAARLTGARAVVSTRHGLGPSPFRLRTELRFWITAAMLCDRVVAVCEAARRNLASGVRPVAHKLVTIRNGAHPPRSGDDDGAAKRGFTLVSVGRLVRAKDYVTLLRAVAVARASVPDLHVWLVGDGDEGPALTQLCAALDLGAVVRFCGERRDVGTWLRAADVFVLSSTSEGLPISMLEAMAAGLPAIVTDVGALPELIALSGAGRIVPARDVDSLARAIVEFAHRRQDLAALGEQASRCYHAHFTPDRMAGDYLALYRTCLRGGAGA